ncbi:hypothetical protein [Amycolatopsis pithecellobii]|uniref:Uncharacterized protein n=1 Tax=Amycolatopsis pithecellobii TaxID=664692 RepID=A0A6N7YR39_9PSEU|nr:hypothetical protein [Amycolatopsis pithecellobii]MTD55485.1 hypothetical protein [Amycolatopsis pithecellobii]
MKITGRTDEAVDSVVWEDDYFATASIQRFLRRLAQTERDEQFLFRESEYDCAFRQIDIERERLARTGESPAALAFAEQVRDEVWRGHDCVGGHDIDGAANAWQVILRLLEHRPPAFGAPW